MASPPRYWIAQHIEDLFRKETSNIGVILQFEDRTLTRFLGEKPDGRIDGRLIRGLAHPRVFMQWVDYWREVCQEEHAIDPAELSGHHYRVIEGGVLTDANASVENPLHMLDYLYNALVSSGGAASALMMDVEREDTIMREQLDNAIEVAFHARGLLQGDDPLHVRYPIKQHEPIQGRALLHKPSFSQLNGKLYVIEHVDFTHRQRQRMSDLAGRTAYMFSDLRDAHGSLETVSLVRVEQEDRTDAVISCIDPLDWSQGKS